MGGASGAPRLSVGSSTRKYTLVIRQPFGAANMWTGVAVGRCHKSREARALHEERGSDSGLAGHEEEMEATGS